MQKQLFLREYIFIINNLKDDASELHNLIHKPAYKSILDNLKKQWKIEITAARGTGKAQVLRYTNDAFPKAKH